METCPKQILNIHPELIKNIQDIKPIYFFINTLKPILNIHPELIKKTFIQNTK